MAIGKLCKIDGCTKILTKTDGRMCQMHRSRWYRHKSYDISPNWPNLKKGQPSLTSHGYIRININGKRILEHVYVMEQHLRRKLQKGERVHHKNHIRTDNKIENLELFINNGDHIKRYHGENWKKRKINPAYESKDIERILERVKFPPKSYFTCFCNKPFYSRNLCKKHYLWAYKHKL